MLAAAPGVSLDAIFSPEHGVTGTLDTTDINNSKDAATGIPVYSVYGGTDAARRPQPEVLRRWMQSCSTFKMRACGFTPTKLRWDIFWRRRPRPALR